MSRESFLEAILRALLSLPQSLKLLLRLAEDPDVPDEGRNLAAGALIHWVSDAPTIPGVRGPLGYVDDALTIHLVFERLVSLAPEVMARYQEVSPEVLASVSDDLDLARTHFGSAMSVLEKAAAGLARLRYKGRTAEQCILDDEAGNWLYEEVQSALVELDLEEDEIARALRGIDSVLAVLRKRSSQ